MISNFFDTRDPLVLFPKISSPADAVPVTEDESTGSSEENNSEIVPRSKALEVGLAGIAEEVFEPSLLVNSISNGLTQTLLTVVKDCSQHLILGNLEYDLREAFTLSDGGQIYLNYKGDGFREGEYFRQFNNKPVLIIIPGVGCTNKTACIENIVAEAQENGYDVVVINYRGTAGMKLKTPKIYGFNTSNDF